jgi:hypothetical protein
VKGHNEKIDVGFRRSVIDDSGARQIGTEVARPEIASGNALRGALKIGGGARECPAMHFALAHQKEPAS